MNYRLKGALPAVGAAICFSALAGCAQPARIDQMSAMPSVELPVASALRHTVQLGNVSGGASTNPLWLSKVGNPEFQAALQSSLGSAGFLADGTGRYRLDTMLVSLDQPLMGFDLTVKSTVHYSLADISSGKSVFDRDIEVEFTAGVSDAVIAVERMRLANEGSIRKNIQAFMDQLISAIGQKPAISQITVRGVPAS